jgi:hypothetical protein
VCSWLKSSGVEEACEFELRFLVATTQDPLEEVHGWPRVMCGRGCTVVSYRAVCRWNDPRVC